MLSPSTVACIQQLYQVVTASQPGQHMLMVITIILIPIQPGQQGGVGTFFGFYWRPFLNKLSPTAKIFAVSYTV